MSKSGQRPSRADVGGQRPAKAPKQKPAAKPQPASDGKAPSKKSGER